MTDHGLDSGTQGGELSVRVSPEERKQKPRARAIGLQVAVWTRLVLLDTSDSG